MQYVLTKEELDDLVLKKDYNDIKFAMLEARRIIVSDAECKRIHYCCDCPIGQMKDYKVRDVICTNVKRWPK